MARASAADAAPTLGHLDYEVGEAYAPPKPAQRALNMTPSAPFTYVAHPDQAAVYLTPDGPKVLPRVVEIPHDPGVGGVSSFRDAEGVIHGDPTVELRELARRGYVVIPQDIEVPVYTQDGDKLRRETHKGYVRRYRGRHGPVHLDVWRRVYTHGRGSRVRVDWNGYFEFLELVHKDYLGGQWDPAVLVQLEGELRDTIRRNTGVQGAEHVVSEAQKRLKAFERRAPDKTLKTGA